MSVLLEKYYPVIVAVLLAIMLTVEATSALPESQTVDEGTHLAAGYSYLLTGDFRMNTEHPPLLKELAALPLLVVSQKLTSPTTSPAWHDYNQWQYGRDFLYQNTLPADIILFLGRLPTMLLSLILGFFIFHWSRQLFGTKGGLLSLLLYAFCPTTIAHARYVTTDLGVTLFFFLTIYYFWKYLKGNKTAHLLASAVFFGLAQASKFSALTLIPIVLFLYVINYSRVAWQTTVRQLFKKMVIVGLTFFLITAGTIFITYGFEVKKPIEDINVQELYTHQEEILRTNSLERQDALKQKIIKVTDPTTPTGQFIKRAAEHVPIPAFSYLNGVVKLLAHNYYGHTAYLLGQYVDYGWWYYFPIAFLVKTPLTTITFLILVAAFGSWLFIRRHYREKVTTALTAIPLSTYCLALPPLFYLIWSMFGNLNVGVRHILPIYPFIYVLVGGLVILAPRSKRQRLIFAFFLTGMVVFYLVSSFRMYPHYLAYFNEAVGGPANGPQYLVDSNIDWGQDVKNLKRYMRDNGITYVCLSYFGQAELTYYGIDYRYLPDNQNFHGPAAVNCVVAISVTSLLSREHEYSWLLNYAPQAKIGYSIYLYDFRQKD